MRGRGLAPDPDPCRWYEDRETGDRYLVPGCIGAAVKGPDGCTCGTPLSLKEQRWRAKYRAAEKALRRERALRLWAQEKLAAEGLPTFPIIEEIQRTRRQP